jgi:hypothetical protein
MVGSSSPVALFYEPGTPPLPFPLLLAHTELADPLAPCLIDNEPLARKTFHFDSAIAPKSQMLKVYMPPSCYPITLTRNAQSPTPKISPTANRGPDSSNSDSGLDDCPDSDAASNSSADSDDVKIQKPPGEPGRPGRGGYNLQAALDWNPKQYSKLKVTIYSVYGMNIIDCTRCTSIA